MSCVTVNTVDRVSRETEIMQLTSNVVSSPSVSVSSLERFISSFVIFVCNSCACPAVYVS